MNCVGWSKGKKYFEKALNEYEWISGYHPIGKQVISFVIFYFFQLLIVACGSGSQGLVTINLHVKAMTSTSIYVRCIKICEDMAKKGPE